MFDQIELSMGDSSFVSLLCHLYPMSSLKRCSNRILLYFLPHVLALITSY